MYQMDVLVKAKSHRQDQSDDVLCIYYQMEHASWLRYDIVFHECT